MSEPTLTILVICPDCALESISEMPIAVIANGLLTGKSLRLYSHCHDRYWSANFTEREGLRKALAELNMQPLTHRAQSPAKQASAAEGLLSLTHC